MQIDYISPVIAIPLAIVLWLIMFTIWFRVPVDNFFANRRHIRRMRNRHRAAITHHSSIAR